MMAAEKTLMVFKMGMNVIYDSSFFHLVRCT